MVKYIYGIKDANNNVVASNYFPALPDVSDSYPYQVIMPSSVFSGIEAPIYVLICCDTLMVDVNGILLAMTETAKFKVYTSMPVNVSWEENSLFNITFEPYSGFTLVHYVSNLIWSNESIVDFVYYSQYSTITYTRIAVAPLEVPAPDMPSSVFGWINTETMETGPGAEYYQVHQNTSEPLYLTVYGEATDSTDRVIQIELYKDYELVGVNHDTSVCSIVYDFDKSQLGSSIYYALVYNVLEYSGVQIATMGKSQVMTVEIIPAPEPRGGSGYIRGWLVGQSLSLSTKDSSDNPWIVGANGKYTLYQAKDALIDNPFLEVQ